MTHRSNGRQGTARGETSVGSGLDVTAPWRTYRYAVVDVEGNGQRPPDLVELAAVPIEAGAIGTPNAWLVRPHRPITPMARRFHKISDDDVADKPNVAEVAAEMRAAVDGAVLVAHNAHVDLDVIGRELDHAPAFTIDTLKLARRFLPGEPSYKLGALVDRLNLAGAESGRPDMTAHRAAYDALMCARLLLVLADTTPNLTLSDLLGTPPSDAPDAPSLF
jgi:DNA polymerase III epsilon subunit-like protein